METWIMIADESARDVLGMKLETDDSPSVSISRMMDEVHDGRKVPQVRMLDFYSALLQEDACALLPIIRSVEQPDAGSVRLDSFAVFKGARMVGELDPDETRGFMFSTEQTSRGDVSAKSGRGTCEASVSASAANLDPILREDGGITLRLEVGTSFTIGAISGYEGYDVERLEAALKQDLKDEEERLIRKCFEKARAINADMYGVAQAVYRKYGESARGALDAWKTVFPRAELELTLSVEVNGNGRITLPIMEEVRR